MAEIDERVRQALQDAAQPPDPESLAGLADSIRAKAAAVGEASGGQGPAGSGGVLGPLVPWFALGIVGFVVTGALAWTGAIGGGGAATSGGAAVGGSAPAAAYFDCPDGTPQGSFRPNARVLAVATADGGWVGVRDPENVNRTVWLAENAIIPDDGQAPLSELPVGGCPRADVLPGAIPEAAALTARVLDSRTGEPVEGVTVQATDALTVDIPGATAVTAADGTFSIPGLTDEEIGVRVDGTAVGHEVGYAGGAAPAPYGWQVFPTWGEASTWSPSDLGDIALDPTFVTGVVRDSATGAPVSGAVVYVTDTTSIDAIGLSAVTAPDGTFVIDGVTVEEYGLRVDATAIGYEAGYVGGAEPTPFGWQVYPTWGEATTWAPGSVGDIAVDPVPVESTTPTTTLATTPPTTITPPPPLPPPPPTPTSTPATPPTTTPTAPTPTTPTPTVPTTPATTPPDQTPPQLTVSRSAAGIWEAFTGITCPGPSNSIITATATDASGIASLRASWSFASIAHDEPMVGGQATFGPFAYTTIPDSTSVDVEITVTASDNAGNISTRTTIVRLNSAGLCFG